MDNIKIGLVGLDTSHSPAFAMLLNNPQEKGHIPGCQVVKAYPGGSELFSSSIERVEGFTKQFRDDIKVEISSSIEELAEGMDAFLLESVDGCQHLEQFKILAEFGKPIFIDKPLVCSYAEAKAIIELAKVKKVPVMTSSSLRFALGISDALAEGETVQACHAFGPMALLEDYRDYFWYGIHSAEILFTMMGKGCKDVRIIATKDYDLLVGTWDDGRIGTITGKRIEPYNFGCALLTNKGERTVKAESTIPWYTLLMKEVVEFFKNGTIAVSNAESLEVIAFLEAASRSRAAGGAIIKLDEL